MVVNLEVDIGLTSTGFTECLFGTTSRSFGVWKIGLICGSRLTSTRVTDAMKAVMKATGLSAFDAVIPNEIGGFNAFEALLAAHRFKKSVLDTDLVARAYPMIWQTVRCLNRVPVVPAAVTDGAGKTEVSISPPLNSDINT